ncbi:DDB1- and CUL4-associated factor 8 isoform X1 [Tetranychus urticae]|nr:DDB1- and CUL4-associated factor 8 isoform X1 [Tetranychus urticae]
MSNSDSSQSPTPRNSEDSDSSLGLRSNSTSTENEDEQDILHYDPTPWTNSFPQPYWFSVRQFIAREIGENVRPDLLEKKPYMTPHSPYWFRKYAYESQYFLQRMVKTHELEGHSGCVNCLNFNSSGNLLCSGSDDRKIKIWDWEKSKLTQSYSSGHTSNIFNCRWCLDNARIVTSGRDGQIRICDVNNPDSSRLIACHLSASHRLTFSDPNTVLSCGEDASVYEIDLRSNRPTFLLVLRNPSTTRPVPLYSINCNMIFTPNYFVVSGRSPKAYIFDRRFLRKPTEDEASAAHYGLGDEDAPGLPGSDIPCPTPVMQLFPPELENSMHYVTSAVYNSTGSKMLMSYNDEDLYVFDVKSGEMEGKFQGHRNSETIKSCSWFGDDFVLSGSDDGFIYGWERKSQHIVMSISSDMVGAVNCIELHPTYPVIAASGLEDSIKIFVPFSDVWPVPLVGIKNRICTNMKERSKDKKRYLLTAGEQIIWTFLRNNGGDDSDSNDENAARGSCLAS